MPTDVEAVDIILGGIQGPPGPTGPPGPAVDPETDLVVNRLDVTTDVSVGGYLDVAGNAEINGYLVVDGSVKASGFFEAGRSVEMGYWQNEPFNAAHFTATTSAGQTPVGAWVLTAPDQLVLRWTLIGKTMLVAWNITASSVTANPNLLRIRIPGGHVGAGLATGTGSNGYTDNGVFGVGVATVIPSSDQILLQKAGFAQWAISVDNTASRGSIAFEIA